MLLCCLNQFHSPSSRGVPCLSISAPHISWGISIFRILTMACSQGLIVLIFFYCYGDCLRKAPAQEVLGTSKIFRAWNLLHFPCKFVLILAERDCQAQPLGYSEITLRSYGKIIVGKLFKTNEDSGGREPNIVVSFRNGGSGKGNGDDTKN